MSNPHEGHRKRLYNMVKKNGFENLTEPQQLEFLLTMTIPRMDTNPIAHALLKTFGSLSAVFDAHYLDLMKVSGVGEKTALLLSSMTDMYKTYTLQGLSKKRTFQSSDEIGQYCRALFFGSKYEDAYVLLLNKAKKLIHTEKISSGGVDYTHVYPERIVEVATRHAAYYVVLTHNHNAGTTNPSPGDFLQTQRVVTALNSINKRILDHIIVCKDNYMSFVENGFYVLDSDDVRNPYHTESLPLSKKDFDE